jgi:hypothetical protein
VKTGFAEALSAEDRTADCRFAEFGCQICLNRRFHGGLFAPATLLFATALSRTIHFSQTTVRTYLPSNSGRRD